nr:transcriptional regulator ATRX-like [Phascolarctos cinereus]
MNEFIPSDSDETSLSLSSDDYPKKKKFKGKKRTSSGGHEDAEVIKVWNSRSRGGGEGHKDELASISSVMVKKEKSESNVEVNFCIYVRIKKYW